MEILPWIMRRDLVVLACLTLLSRAANEGEQSVGLHFAFYDRYWRLACWHEAHGRVEKARKLKTRALAHWEVIEPDSPPPAVAAAMPVLSYFFTNAVSKKTVKAAKKHVA
jgi:hypothetical protein